MSNYIIVKVTENTEKSRLIDKISKDFDYYEAFSVIEPLTLTNSERELLEDALLTTKSTNEIMRVTNDIPLIEDLLGKLELRFD